MRRYLSRSYAALVESLDDVDRGLVHALQLDGRAPFSAIAAALNVSEHTVARRYRRLREAGLLRVVGAVNGTRLGYTSWTVRIRCTPDAALPIAAALTRRDDTFWVHILSGGTELSCNLQPRSAEDRDALLLTKLPRTTRVLGITAHAVLGSYADPMGWPGLAFLPESKAKGLRPEPPEPSLDVVELADGDRAILDRLAVDGRSSHTELAMASGWSESTVRRRLEQLRREGVLMYDVDIAPATLGFTAEARLWLSVRPSALADTAKALAEHPEVSFAAITTGPTNLMATVHCRRSDELARYLTERVASLDAIATLESAPVMRTLKRNGAVIS